MFCRFYFPEEAGEEGKRVSNYKGAVFLSDHTDQNEANCILNRVHIARKYSDYIFAREKKNIATSSDSEATKAKKLTSATTVLETSLISVSGGSSDNEYESLNSDEVVPSYFVAGKFNPSTGRVTEWDPDISNELHLEEPGPPSPPKPSSSFPPGRSY